MKIGFVKRPSARLLIVATIAVLVLGVIVGLMGSIGAQTAKNANVNGLFGSAVPASSSGGSSSGSSNGPTNTPVGNSQASYGAVSSTTIVEQTQTAISSSSTGNSIPISGSSSSGQPQANSPQVQNLNRSGFIEFFSNVTVNVASAETALNKATAIAITYGGYLAYSSYSNLSSIAVLRIPAPKYASALTEIEGLGNLTGLQSNSNDVSIQYTDLNATLQSLLTEQTSLLKLENSSNSLNATILLEGQIQGVDTQINEIQSQILQTRLLVDYSTITANFNLNVAPPPPKPLSMKLTATPTSGLNPLSVTFNAIVTGGEMPYIVNYNFADGSTYQGQTVIHEFAQSGTFNVTVTVTDNLGNVLENYTLIHVTNPPAQSGLTSFASFAFGLLVSVVEGIIEVAVVLLPIALVVGAVILPFRNRMKATRKDDLKS